MFAHMDVLLPLALSNDKMSWVVYMLGAITVVYIVVRPMMRRKKDPLATLPSLGVAQQRHVEREMQNLLVEMSEMARQITAQLDTRAAKLEALLREADQKIEQLRCAGDTQTQANGSQGDRNGAARTRGQEGGSAPPCLGGNRCRAVPADRR